MRNINLTLLLIVLCFCSLNACGKKGGLYLPAESGSERVIKSDPQIITPDDSENAKESKKKPSAQ
ncbi:MAG: lipoprotein [Thiohalomonadales bacterium]